MSASTSRNRRNQPYGIDELLIQFHHSAAGIAWRWRTELILLLGTAAALWQLALAITLIWAAVVLTAFVVLVLVLPWTRRFITNRFWCVLGRHRLQRLCWEARLHTRSGRIPLILWIRPTKVGWRAHILCRAGICAKDFEDNAAQLAAACYAREARVTHNPKWSHLVTIHVIRHDTLAASQSVPSPLPALRAHHDPVATGAVLADTRP
jgi:hypothetical protein